MQLYRQQTHAGTAHMVWIINIHICQTNRLFYCMVWSSNLLVSVTLFKMWANSGLAKYDRTLGQTMAQSQSVVATVTSSMLAEECNKLPPMHLPTFHCITLQLFTL